MSNKKAKAKKRNTPTQENNDGAKKIERMTNELRRNPNNMKTAMRLAELKKLHHG
jgi:cytochrome c-type biogenesis protein CcmH/NrfG